MRGLRRKDLPDGEDATPAQREFAHAVNFPEMFCMSLAKYAWGWKNIDAWQREVILDLNKRMFLACSRQSGKSSILSLKAFHRALTKPNALILVIAEQRQSNEDLRKCRELAFAYDKMLRQKWDNKVTCTPLTDSVTSIELANGSRIIALPATGKVRGFSAPEMVIIDEAAWVEDEVFVAVDPMLTVSEGQLILASTPNGTSNFFHTESRNPEYHHYRVPWTMCPRISKEKIENKRMLYGDAFVKQEYEVEFLDAYSALFSERALRESFEQEEEVFNDEMSAINQELLGTVELI